MIISFKTKTNLISELLKQKNIIELKKQSIFSKIVSKKEFAHIYFHSGILDKEAFENIENSKLTIVSSNGIKNKICLTKGIKPSKIEVIYPSVNIKYEKPKTLKKEFYEQFSIPKDKRIILFTAKDFKTSGIKEFINIVTSLQSDNFHTIIAGDKKQITSLQFQEKKISLIENITLLEDYKDIDELFLVSDIYILPSYKQTFSINVLKAMFCKCAVFVTSLNYANELVDIFSTMDEPDDRSMVFKVDAILQNEEELKQIQKTNRKNVLKHSIENKIEEINKKIFNLNLT